MAKGPNTTIDIPRRGASPEHIQQLWTLVDLDSRIVYGEGEDAVEVHWRDLVNCHGLGPTRENPDAPDLFIPSRGASTMPARRICWKCKVEEQCLIWAILARQDMGVFGGMTKDERRELAEGLGIWPERGYELNELQLREARRNEANRPTELGEKAREVLIEIRSAMGYEGRIAQKRLSWGR